MNPKLRNALLVAGALVVATTVARAQSADPIGDLLSPAPEPTAPAPPPARQTVAQPLSYADQAALKDGLNAARRADIAGARAAIARTSHPIARKLMTWALVDANAEALSFHEVDAARRRPRGS